jgi:hypothetical protein
VFHPMEADCKHPLLCLPGTGIASQEAARSGSFQQSLAGICKWSLEADYGMDPGEAVFRWSILSTQLQTLSL